MDEKELGIAEAGQAVEAENVEEVKEEVSDTASANPSKNREAKPTPVPPREKQTEQEKMSYGQEP